MLKFLVGSSLDASSDIHFVIEVPLCTHVMKPLLLHVLCCVLLVYIEEV